MQEFRRRYYSHPSDLFADMRMLDREHRRIRALRQGRSIDRALQERLVLAVTEVNGCRYCAYAHARLALAAGLTKSDVEAFAQGDLGKVPTEQVPALLYAQHWAEADGDPDPDLRQRIVETYGSDETAAMELAMRTIRVGNLLGNTTDYLIYRASFGRWGNRGR
jgi:AhpD family alkylhydroperoxidase